LANYASSDAFKGTELRRIDYERSNMLKINQTQSYFSASRLKKTFRQKCQVERSIPSKFQYLGELTFILNIENESGEQVYFYENRDNKSHTCIPLTSYK
jgi:hypothetical protein